MTDNLLPFRRAEHRELSDETLVFACAAGDAWALEELFCRHSEQVHRVLVRLRYVDREDLDDIVQTTFLEVYRAAERFHGRAAVRTWILGIAMNVMRHHVRDEARRRLAMSAVATVSLTIDDRRPDDQADHRQSLARAQVEFEALPQEFQIIFTLCDLEGLRGVDVAVALGIPEGTVWRRLHEARLRLRACIEGEVRR
jgi:RNA polymerase sigma-70 factor (ECF subfamily)